MGDPKLSYNFTSDPSLAAFAIPPPVYIKNNALEGTINNKPVHARFACVGAMAFHPQSSTSNQTAPRILLIKRAASDSIPNRWEIPGGGCDDDDPSILHSVVRELYEEAGLVATSIKAQVGPPVLFLTSSAKVVCKFSFLVEVAASTTASNEDCAVVLDPAEHQDYVWATEGEVRAGKASGKELLFTFDEQKAAILDAFAVRARQ